NSPDPCDRDNLAGTGLVHNFYAAGFRWEAGIHDLGDHGELHFVRASSHVDVAVVSALANCMWRRQMGIEFQMNRNGSLVLDLLHEAGTQGQGLRLKRGRE